MTAALLAKPTTRLCDDCGAGMPFVILGFNSHFQRPQWGWQCLDCGLVRPEWWDHWIEVSAIVQSWRKPR